ncbi:tRNA uridine-5-carboxymethylaminomethyl(34) synthesis GTPase MnmE [Pontivivens insulae]|uniref:tRNA modification GTPase MnmE n=1 Tax=Pontivivens insulae TaxID=1639689 RepID=A0A2R8A7S1_9RHOB|nr:tRNA uridine-5-carboxymethylaminomethyl(34) synthesis GTPase MnmE [Pontivivens insulae]RED18338.1 tRNA modification GTPase trmE [Pontivivens insulae]SPF28236.1 tRNA modification GTPase MnmE [Pontivivens insulae]
MQDTIYALASGSGRAGVAVIRLSGPQAIEIASKLCRSLPEPGSHALRKLRMVETGELIDEALILRFAAGASFTGEDVVEFQCHGSLAVVAAMGTALESYGARPADRGEFTRRALENGMLDLTQVEGLADLIDADTEAQRKQAFRVMQGNLSEAVETWRADLLRALALLAANIDFADEEIPDDLVKEIVLRIKAVRTGIAAQLDGAKAAQRIRSGFEVAIIGRPNAGKSTLFNRLAGSDAAITSSIAGTTRDVIEVRLDIGGNAVSLLDTAGLRETEDEIEALGVARAKKRALEADLRVALLEPGQAEPDDDVVLGADDLIVRGKSDISAEGTISGVTGDGIAALLQAISQRISADAAESSLLIRQRHKSALATAVERLDLALALCEMEADMSDLISEEVRLAVRSLDVLVGRIDVEDLLGEIFSSFCIGK